MANAKAIKTQNVVENTPKTPVEVIPATTATTKRFRHVGAIGNLDSLVSKQDKPAKEITGTQIAFRMDDETTARVDKLAQHPKVQVSRTALIKACINSGIEKLEASLFPKED